MKIKDFLAVGALVVATGCAQAGAIGDVLGGVLSPAPANQLTGTVSGVDTRAQTVFVRDNSGQTIALSYDSRTKVVYQNQEYQVTALDPGDQVTARVSETGNGAYYTDLIQVNSSAGTSGSNNVVTVTGTVRSVDTSRGLFTMTSNNQTVTVTLPYNARAVDVDRLRALRTGQSVRLQGSWLSDTRIELYQFL